jgi:hypothetical protein
MISHRTRQPSHRTKKSKSNGRDPAMLDTTKPNDRMQFVRLTMRASEMYAILCGMLDADTPEKLQALRTRANGVRFEIESGQRSSAATNRSPK